MTHSDTNDDTRRDAERTGGQLPPSDLTSQTNPGKGKPATSSAAGSNASESAKLSSAGRSGTNPSSTGTPRPKTDATPTEGGHENESRDRSADVKTSSHGDRSPSRSNDGARDESSRASTGRGDGGSEALRSLISCIEQIVREIPRGAAARFEGVTEELRKARKALDGSASGSSLASPGVRSEGSKAISSAPRSADTSSSSSSRMDRSDEIRPSQTPPSQGGR